MLLEEIIFIGSDILMLLMLIANLIVYWKIDKKLKDAVKQCEKEEKENE